jgi:hypothetical protein
MEDITAYGRQKRKNTGISLAKECYSMKLDLLTNATVVDDAIKFVNEKAKSRADIGKEDREEADIQRFESTTITAGTTTTRNQVF